MAAAAALDNPTYRAWQTIRVAGSQCVGYQPISAFRHLVNFRTETAARTRFSGIVSTLVAS
jgi:hypothetical protein